MIGLFAGFVLHDKEVESVKGGGQWCTGTQLTFTVDPSKLGQLPYLWRIVGAKDWSIEPYWFIGSWVVIVILTILIWSHAKNEFVSNPWQYLRSITIISYWLWSFSAAFYIICVFLLLKEHKLKNGVQKIWSVYWSTNTPYMSILLIFHRTQFLRFHEPWFMCF